MGKLNVAGYKELLGVIKMLYILISVVITQMSTVAKTHQAEYFKWRILFIKLCCSKVDRVFGNTYTIFIAALL